MCRVINSDMQLRSAVLQANGGKLSVSKSRDCFDVDIAKPDLKTGNSEVIVPALPVCHNSSSAAAVSVMYYITYLLHGRRLWRDSPRGALLWCFLVTFYNIIADVVHYYDTSQVHYCGVTT